MLLWRNSANSAKGVSGVMIEYGWDSLRMNLDMYFFTESFWRGRKVGRVLDTGYDGGD